VTTSDATPDTPDPRLVATIREFIVEEVGFDGGAGMTDQAERLAKRIQGSLRSQASDIRHLAVIDTTPTTKENP
jgi:hypothetical protein